MAYKIYSLSRDNIPFYVGCTTTPLHRRAISHRFKGKQDFSIELIEESEVKKTEEYWIHQFLAWGFPLVNQHLTPGFKITAEQREARSKQILKRYEDPKERKKAIRKDYLNR